MVVTVYSSVYRLLFKNHHPLPSKIFESKSEGLLTPRFQFVLVLDSVCLMKTAGLVLSWCQSLDLMTAYVE